uniref:Laccase-2 n=1 Tax=Cacopsylla melanoneura TaxID=428564 RepID=A0A8D8WL32_9HEMI
MILNPWLLLTVTLYLTIQPSECRIAGRHPHSPHSALQRMEFMYDYRKPHPCRRPCIEGQPPMTCTYNFHIEWYYTMSKACFDCPYNVTDCGRLHCIPADGMKRAITIVNRQMPGPSVDVCVGDHVIVDLMNGLMEESTSIHWHGHHQVDSPYMDGVPHLTQCPVPPRTTFRYRFQADSPGTHFWHSHTGSQRGDGAFGAFIIRKPLSREVHGHLYDHDLPEHVMHITDWSHMLGIEMFNAHHHSDGDNKPPTILMNGKGRFKKFRVGGGTNVTYTPMEVFTVKKGHSYRFRIINAGYLNCPVELSIDNHKLIAINTDGGDIRPITVGSIVSYAGERWDFILNATRPIGNYWIKMRGLMDCDERFTSAFQAAVLKYEGATTEDPPGAVDYNATRTTGMVLNPLNTPSNQSKSTLITELSAVDAPVNDIRLRDHADLKYFISYDFYGIDNPHFHLSNMYGFHEVKNSRDNHTQQVRTPQLNHLSFRFPSFPLLSQRDQIDDTMFCSNMSHNGCSEEYCECTNVVNVPLHSVVELIIIDEGVAYDANHPFHLHGHPFRVVAMERVGKTITRQQVIDMDKRGEIKRNLDSAPLKDTVTVPDGGFTIIRFHATNPGYWLFHCHIEFHVETGMALVFKVGEHEDMTPVPNNFPTCNNYFYNENDEPQHVDNDIPLLEPEHVDNLIPQYRENNQNDNTPRNAEPQHRDNAIPRQIGEPIHEDNGIPKHNSTKEYEETNTTVENENNETVEYIDATTEHDPDIRLAKTQTITPHLGENANKIQPEIVQRIQPVVNTARDANVNIISNNINRSHNIERINNTHPDNMGNYGNRGVADRNNNNRINKTYIASPADDIDIVYEENKSKDKVKYTIGGRNSPNGINYEANNALPTLPSNNQEDNDDLNEENRNTFPSSNNENRFPGIHSTNNEENGFSISTNEEGNDVDILTQDEIGVPNNSKNTYDTKDENILNRWARSISKSIMGSENKMSSTSLIIAGTSFVILLIAIVFTVYKACR